MAGSRSTNTMAEALQRFLSDLAEMKVLPDADLPFIIDLETRIIQKVREPIERMQAAGITAVPGMPGMAGGPPMPMQPPGPPMAGPMPMPPGGGMPMPPGAIPGADGGGGQFATTGGGVPGLRQEPQMPNPDELRRLLSH